MTSMYHLVADRESYRESMLLMAQTFCLALLIFMPSVWLARTHKQADRFAPLDLNANIPQNWPTVVPFTDLVDFQATRAGDHPRCALVCGGVAFGHIRKSFLRASLLCPRFVVGS